MLMLYWVYKILQRLGGNSSNKAHVMPVKVEILALSLHIVFVQKEAPTI